MFTTAMTVQCDVYIDFVQSYVEVVKSLSYCSRKLSVSSTQTKPLTTKIHEMCNKIWLLQYLLVSNHVISPSSSAEMKIMNVMRNFYIYVCWKMIQHHFAQ